MYGEIGAWFYKALAGINFDPQQPGFKNILLKPHFVKELTYVKAFIIHRMEKLSPHGKEWATK